MRAVKRSMLGWDKITESEGAMTDKALNSGSVSLVSWLARLEKPLEIVAVIIIFAITGFMYWIGGHEAANVAALCLIVTVASLPHRFRQIQKRRRGLETLNRFAPGHRPKSLGI
jgi:hypothetical protein